VATSAKNDAHPRPYFLLTSDEHSSILRISRHHKGIFPQMLYFWNPGKKTRTGVCSRCRDRQTPIIFDEPGKGIVMLKEDEEKPVPTPQPEEGSKRGRTIRARYGEDYFHRIGTKGGNTLKEKRGSEYYRTIAEKGGKANMNKYGSSHFSEMGKRGGNTTRERQDADFYRRIGQKGGEARRRKKEEK
jgi:general stress protein YciG